MPLLNRIDISLKDGANNILDTHVLDYNRRLGYDATGEATLDLRNVSVPYMDPFSFDAVTPVVETRIIIPDVWIQEHASVSMVHIETYDIWGNAIASEYQLDAMPHQVPIVSEIEWESILGVFQSLHPTTTFPLSGRSFDDVFSTFGPRLQSGSYDFHRGVDIDSVIGESVIAPYGGTFWGYSESPSGGFTLVLRHDLPEPVVYGGQAHSYFYTYYLHLFDDQIPANSISTDDVVDGWIPGVTTVTAGQIVAKAGDSGSSGQSHLHFGLRLGTPLTLEYQTVNVGDTRYYGFDPHLNPLQPTGEAQCRL